MALSPASGPAGQSVTLTGTGFYNPAGDITVDFGGQEAPFDCPSQGSCTATAPDGPTPGTTVPVTVTTGSGSSNTESYTYQ